MDDSSLKLKTIKDIDKCINEKKLKKIDEIFLELMREENVDLKFAKTLLGYTGIYSREIKEWKNFQDFIKKIENK